MKGLEQLLYNSGVISIRLSLVVLGLALLLGFLTRVVYAQSDSEAPVTDLVLSPDAPDGSNGWYRSPVNITLTGVDLESGVSSIRWRLNSSNWESRDFSSAVNLAPNPSFENGSEGGLDGWQFSGASGSSGVKDPNTGKFGLSSAKVIAPMNGWSGWDNSLSYIALQPFANMTASVWVKTSGVSGAGAYFRIYSLSPSGSQLIGSTNGISGTNDWTFVSNTFTVSSSDAYGLYLDLGVEGTGTVWYDGVSIQNIIVPTQATFTISSNGFHQLEYYSVDQVGNEEIPHHQQALKIDTVSPFNWRGFETTRAGSDHQLISQISVDDSSSGLDQTNTSFQYSTDGGSSWGYYQDSSRCGGTWNEAGWLSNLSFSGAGNTWTLTTPTVDFCNSNWSICKIVRFRARDMAGNESTKDICINGAWATVSGGDVYAGEDISMGAAGAGDNTDGLILTPSAVISNFSSSHNWVIANYDHALTALTFNSLISKFSSLTTTTTLPKVSGYFQTVADLTIDRNTIPSGLNSANFGAIVFVNGDLIINSDYSFGPAGGIIFIVSGDVLVDKDVTDAAGFFITDGSFDSAYNGGTNADALTLRGGVVAGRVTLSRSLRSNNGTPAETFVFEPKYYALLGNAFSTYSILWKEVKP